MSDSSAARITSASCPRSTLRARSPWALLLVALGCLAACRSAEEYRDDADEEVYAIVTARLAELIETDSFSVDPPAESLRERVLSAATAGEEVNLPPLSFLDCLEIAAESSRDYQTQRESLYLFALSLTLERFQFGVIPDATADATVAENAGAADTFDANGDFTLSRLFGSGALVVGGIGLDLFKVLSGGGDDWDTATRANISITQPILRGFGTRMVMEPLTQAERDVVYQARDYERFRRTLAFDVASQMFRIAQQATTLKNEQQNRESLVDIRLRNEAFAEAGQLLDIEVDQARQNELSAENRVVAAQLTLQGLYDDFKLFLGLPLDLDLRIRVDDMGVLFGIEVPELEPVEEVATTVALERRLDHLNNLGLVVDAERRVYITENLLGPGLEFDFDISTASPTDQPLDYGSATAPWDVRLDLDLPVNRRAERNNYRSALINLQARVRGAELSADRVHAQVRDALREVTAATEQVAIQEQSVILAERRVESARMQQQAGRATTRDLLESQQALLDARNAAVQAGVDSALSRLALYRDMELLRVDQRGLWVDVEPLGTETE